MSVSTSSLRGASATAPPARHAAAVQAAPVQTASGVAHLHEVGPRPLNRSDALRSHVADLVELTKPRIAVMALTTVALGYLLAAGPQWRVLPLLSALLGIALVAVSSSVLNQWVERVSDKGMPRTANRPLPAGRISAAEAVLIGLGTGVVGVAHLAIFVNPLTAWLGLATLLCYVAVYTPLKKHSAFCTTIGAIPGAMPPVLGWAAASGSLDLRAWFLFAILFLWQFPHFLSIAWLYREQYAGAGLKMLPKRAGVIAVSLAVALLVVTGLAFLPHATFAGLSLGPLFASVAVAVGTWYVIASWKFARHATRETARGLLFASLIHLPVLLAALVIDSWLPPL